ncbi:hypothetical protein PVAND_007721 [Polypedilum vanderplanki]|uniref:SUN domain-containing protein n=1 Tax=Polypedilum vanderplanki TaxID=319348 RepID=A0A9J6C780_POLVA|nr:hypothetical protein PVAND_007721 [Polypedilum vanderplanki]
MPQISFKSVDFGWLWTPFITIGVALREFMFGTVQSKDQLKIALDEDKFQILLQHIDNYIDTTIGQKLDDNNKIVMDQVNDRLLLIIANNVKDAINQYEYQLTTKDIEAIVTEVRKHLNEDLNQLEKSILSKISFESQETVKKISNIASASIDQNREIKMNNQKVDLNEILMMILSSDKLFSLIDGRLKPIIGQLELHDVEIDAIKADLKKLRLEIVDKFTFIDDNIKDVKSQQKVLADDLYKFKFENDEALHNFMMIINEKLSNLPGYTSIDQSVRKNLLSILGFNFEDPNANTIDENSVKNWISSTFVAKSYLEERLNNLELNSDKVFKLELDKNAGVLMEEINKEIKSQIALALLQKNNEHASNLNLSGGDSILTEEDVLRIVKGVLAIYDADKTGLVDYALESAGGEVISTRCTENYQAKSAEISIFGIPIWYPSNTPRTVISPSIAPGECWAFQGFPGFLVIKLHNLINVTGFSMEHIPKTNAPNGNIDSAPNNFTVWGLTEEFDKNPVLLGTYYYSNEENSPSLQYFPVQNKQIDRPYQIVELRIESNHGNLKYTCLYRFRVHGNIKQ